jgi:ABC-type polysaccharide/polyol phosphate export permease
LHRGKNDATQHRPWVIDASIEASFDRAGPRCHFMRIGEAMTPQYADALRDVVEGVFDVRMWGRLGWQEVKRRYRRTVFGPFWSTLSLSIFIFSLGFVWANLWKQDPATYLPFLCGGLLAWTLVSSIITESCVVFTSAEGLIKQLRFSFTALSCAVVWRNLIVFGHNVAILAVIDVVFHRGASWHSLLAIPGLAIVCFNGVWVGLLLGLVCSRYRDVSQLIGSILQISLFITPIFWTPAQLGGGLSSFVDYNLLFHFVDLIRAPLLGEAPSLWSYEYVGLASLIGWTATLAIFARFRRRVAYWL